MPIRTRYRRPWPACGTVCAAGVVPSAPAAVSLDQRRFCCARLPGWPAHEPIVPGRAQALPLFRDPGVEVKSSYCFRPTIEQAVWYILCSEPSGFPNNSHSVASNVMNRINESAPTLKPKNSAAYCAVVTCSQYPESLTKFRRSESPPGPPEGLSRTTAAAPHCRRRAFAR